MCIKLNWPNCLPVSLGRRGKKGKRERRRGWKEGRRERGPEEKKEKRKQRGEGKEQGRREGRAGKFDYIAGNHSQTPSSNEEKGLVH